MHGNDYQREGGGGSASPLKFFIMTPFLFLLLHTLLTIEHYNYVATRIHDYCIMCMKLVYKSENFPFVNGTPSVLNLYVPYTSTAQASSWSAHDSILVCVVTRYQQHKRRSSNSSSINKKVVRPLLH